MLYRQTYHIIKIVHANISCSKLRRKELEIVKHKSRLREISHFQRAQGQRYAVYVGSKWPFFMGFKNF